MVRALIIVVIKKAEKESPPLLESAFFPRLEEFIILLR